ncbi:hypothetical protein EUGRSUZ_I02071 [Eucalyptus grandis]|uniref:Uncharacterized protein n=2 Tax=Eucalyptus grandis TaxID=71139 RepID=A0ACC3JIK7_EUCGR|nr:hypothetical protein EUGRSUZ_I02071 [Eucalyptus grandis]
MTAYTGSRPSSLASSRPPRPRLRGQRNPARWRRRWSSRASISRRPTKFSSANVQTRRSRLTTHRCA